MAKTQNLKFKRNIKAPVAEVYRAVTNSTALREWFCDFAFTEPRKDGRAYFAWNDGYYAVGRFSKADPGRKVSFSWQGSDDPEPTQVKISVAEKKSGAGLTVEHDGIGTGKKWGKQAEVITAAWELALENLQSVLETGEDMRLTMRPMLGISGLEDLTPESAERLGTPVQTGVRLDGTVEGMGAEAAGLLKDDVLVGIGKAKIVSFTDLISGLQKRRAGDTVAVTYYRGAEKLTSDMTLSKRPLPEIPWTAEGLAEAARQSFDKASTARREALKDVTEAEADFRPGPKDWTVKETLAHLIHGERDNQSVFGELTTGQERWYDAFGGNSLSRSQATARALGSLAAMLQALDQAEAETVALLAALPPEFVARKSSYWRVAFVILSDGGTHNRDHLRQIAETVSAARQAASQPG